MSSITKMINIKKNQQKQLKNQRRSDSATNYSKTVYVFAVSVALLMLFVEECAGKSLLVGHYHHNKRQMKRLNPQLTLDVEPHPGLTQAFANHTPVTEYYFPIDSGRFNFTCTIKHPSFRYKLTITREQIFNNGVQGPPVNMIDSNDYKLSSKINDKRMSVGYSEPELEPGANFLRVSLIIDNLKIKDNAIYTCKYSTIEKSIKAIVFKSPTQNDITLTTNSETFFLDQPNKLTCRVSDVYPKPTIAFMHAKRNDLTESVEEEDISLGVRENSHYLFSIQSTIVFTPKYTDNNQQLNCSVASHTSTNTTLYKTLHLAVIGVQIIEEECNELQAGNLGDLNAKIVCVFYSNPRQHVSFETTPDLPTTPASAATAFETRRQSGGSQESLPSSDDLKDAGKMVASKLTTLSPEASAASGPDPDNTNIKLFDGDDNNNYNVKVEEYGAANSGLYKAVLIIKQVRVQDLKDYTFKLDKFERVIRFGKHSELLKELQVGGGYSTANRNHHAKNNAFVVLAVHSIIAFLACGVAF